MSNVTPIRALETVKQLEQAARRYALKQIQAHVPNYDSERWAARSTKYQLENALMWNAGSPLPELIESERWLGLWYLANPTLEKCALYKAIEQHNWIIKQPLRVIS